MSQRTIISPPPSNDSSLDYNYDDDDYVYDVDDDDDYVYDVDDDDEDDILYGFDLSQVAQTLQMMQIGSESAFSGNSDPPVQVYKCSNNQILKDQCYNTNSFMLTHTNQSVSNIESHDLSRTAQEYYVCNIKIGEDDFPPQLEQHIDLTNDKVDISQQHAEQAVQENLQVFEVEESLFSKTSTVTKNLISAKAKNGSAEPAQNKLTQNKLAQNKSTQK